MHREIENELKQTKCHIHDDNIDVICFDVFGTLVVKQLFNQRDLFQLMQDDYQNITSNSLETAFFDMRIQAEELCIKEKNENDPTAEGISLDEIYDKLKLQYSISNDCAEIIKQREIELETFFSIPRKTGQCLYNEAVQAGKTIVVVADTYLPEYAIQDILMKCGYKEVSHVFVSSENRVTKKKGSIYDILPFWLGIQKDRILNIGDDYRADYLNAQRRGLNAAYIPSAQDMFWGLDESKICINTYWNKWFRKTYACGIPDDANTLGTRCILSLVINKFWDLHNNESYRYFEGYALIGTVLVSFAKFSKVSIRDVLTTLQIPDEEMAFGVKNLINDYLGMYEPFSNVIGNSFLYLERLFYKSFDWIDFKYQSIDCLMSCTELLGKESRITVEKWNQYVLDSDGRYCSFFSAANDLKIILDNVENAFFPKTSLYGRTVRKISKNIRDNAYNHSLISAIFNDELEKLSAELKKVRDSLPASKKVILFAGEMASFDNGACNFCNSVCDYLMEYKSLMLVEWPYMPNERIADNVKFDYIVAPKFSKLILPGIEITCPKKIKKLVLGTEALKATWNNMCAKWPETAQDACCLATFYLNKYLDVVLHVLNPSRVIMWNEFIYFHLLLQAKCKEKGINISFMEFGSVPGTIAIDMDGQMGKSFAGKYPQEFNKICVTSDEISNAAHILDYIKSNNIRRYEQNESDSCVRNLLDSRKKTILFAGSNDIDSGLVPYSDDSQEYISPSFTSSNAALFYISTLNKEGKWNILYKPHPQMYRKSIYTEYKTDSGVIVVGNVDINRLIDVADVVITLVSQVAYMALMKDKPVVMLGYTQLKSKNCTYEAYNNDEISSAISNAISNGFTEEMRDNFIKHVAQMLKYNLYDDLKPRELRYGKKIEEIEKLL